MLTFQLNNIHKERAVHNMYSERRQKKCRCLDNKPVRTMALCFVWFNLWCFLRATDILRLISVWHQYLCIDSDAWHCVLMYQVCVINMRCEMEITIQLIELTKYACCLSSNFFRSIFWTINVIKLFETFCHDYRAIFLAFFHTVLQIYVPPHWTLQAIRTIWIEKSFVTRKHKAFHRKRVYTKCRVWLINKYSGWIESMSRHFSLYCI